MTARKRRIADSATAADESATAPADDSCDPGTDAGASSDGDASWAQSPHTEDPDVDRSIPAVITRTQGE